MAGFHRSSSNCCLDQVTSVSRMAAITCEHTWCVILLEEGTASTRIVSWVKRGYVVESMKPNDSHSSSDLFHEVLGEKDYGEWELIPSPKPTAEDKATFGQFVSVYASFSNSFAVEALQNLKQSSNEVVLDPYSGAGTTLAAAGKVGLASHGFDLSPFSVALGKLRLSTSHAKPLVYLPS